jgi:hypothetical protein
MKRSIVVSAALFSFVTTLSGCAGEIETGEGSTETPFALANPDLRIAIVGAGPSGLTAARELQMLGYQNVTVFEQNNRVGGKVNSIKIGTLNAELGAVFASPDYRLVLGLAEEYGIQYGPYDKPKFVYDNGKKTYQEFLLQHYTPAQIGAAVQNYARVLQTYPQIFADKMDNLPPELEQNFDAFARAEGIEPIAEMAKSLVVGFGYGYYTDVPAIYILKILDMLVKVGPTGLEQPTYFTFPTGFQSLWEAVAAELDVRLNSKVTRITRRGGVVDLTINGFEKRTFDKVIISAPLSAVPSFVDLNPAEKALFSKVKTSRYFITLFAALNIPGAQSVFVHDNATADRVNHVAVWASPSATVPVYSAYQITDKYIPSFLVTTVLAADMLQMAGGIFLAQVQKKEWTDYFPRVSATDLRQDFYERVEDLQGNGGIYYVGGTLSFETVETSARYAQSLVQDNFGAAAGVVAP